MDRSSTKVRVIIVNYRTPALAIECLRSLAAEVAARPGTRVEVVDNASGDESARRIAAAIEAEGWSGWAELTCSPVNGGFAYGNNLALRRALAAPDRADYFWLLNPDTLVRAGALEALAAFMDRTPRAGIAGSAIDEQGDVPWPCAFRFPTLWSELDSGLRLGVVTRMLERWALAKQMSDAPEQIDWVSGASMFARAAMFDEVGLMDEGFFLYFEETDLCRRAARAGWQCWYAPLGRVMHIAGQSTGVTVRTDKPRRLPRYWFESRRRYFVKHHGRLYAAATDAVWMAAHLVWRVRRAAQRKPDTDPPWLWRDFLRNSAIIRAGLPGNDAVKQRPSSAQPS
jgi:N-acetylglucosaminyl-diphospho-decaprenol L-rhamnosyltransferase